MLYKNVIKWCAGLLYVSLAAPLVYNTAWFQSFVSPKVLWFSFFVDCAAVLFLCALVLRRETFRYLFSPVLAGLCLFGVSLSVSAIFGVDSIRSFWGSLLRFQGLFLLWHGIVCTCMLLYVFRASREYITKFVLASVWIAVGAALYGVAELVFGSVLFPDLNLPRVASFFGNPIYFANYLTIPVFLSLYGQVRVRSRVWLYAWVIPGVLILGMLISVSRGALLGLAAGLLMMGVIWCSNTEHRRKLFARKKVLASIVILCIVLSAAVLQMSRFQRLTFFQDQNIQSRLLLWSIAWKGFLKHPWLGVGPENFSYAVNESFSPRLYAYQAAWSDKPHNTLLEVGVTGGFVGLLCYIGLFGLGLWTVHRAYRARSIGFLEAAALGGGFVAYAVQNVFSFDTPAALVTFCLLLALIGISDSGTAHSTTQFRSDRKALAFVVWAASLAGLAWLVVCVYRPVVGVLGIMGREEVLHPTMANQTKSLTAELLTRRFVWDRGYVALVHADAVLTNTISHTPQSQDSLSQAIQVLQSITRRSPYQLQYWLKLEDLYIRRALLADTQPGPDAEYALERARHLAPNRAEVWFAVAALRASEHKLPEAKWAVAKALELDPAYAQALWLQVNLLVESGAIQEAQAQAERALGDDIWPGRVEDLQWLFDRYAKQNETLQSIHLLDTAVRHYVQNAEFQFNAAGAYIRVGQTDKARVLLYRLQEFPGGVDPDKINTLLESIK